MSIVFVCWQLNKLKSKCKYYLSWVGWSTRPHLTDWLAHALSHFWFLTLKSDPSLETCHLWDIWSEWWGNMKWPICCQFLCVLKIWAIPGENSNSNIIFIVDSPITVRKTFLEKRNRHWDLDFEWKSKLGFVANFFPSPTRYWQCFAAWWAQESRSSDRRRSAWFVA